MKSALHAIYIHVALLLTLSGCGASRPPDIVVRPMAPPPPDPEAVGHYIDAKRFEMQGEREAAVLAIRAAIATDSSSSTLYGALARNLNALRREAEALDPARRAVRLSPAEVEYRWQLYQALISGVRDTAAAVEQLETITHLNPGQVAAYDHLLRIFRATRRRDDILRTLDRVMALPDLSVRGRFIAAERYLRNDAPDRAASAYREIVGEEPGHADAWRRLSRIVLSQADTLGAARMLRQALPSIDPPSDAPKLWSQLILIYRSDVWFDSLMAESPPDTAFAWDLASVFVTVAAGPKSSDADRSHNYGRAERLLDRLIQIDPQRHDTRGAMARIYLSTGRPGKARTAFREAFNCDPKAEYWIGIGHAYIAEGQSDRAISVFEDLYRQAPKKSAQYPRIAFELGRLYRSLGRLADARAVYQKASETHPGRLMYRFELGRTHILGKDWEEAREIFDDLLGEVEEDPGLFAQVLFNLGLTYERTGRFDDSVEVFQRLLALEPDNDEALNYLGYMLAEKGVRLGEAENLVSRALKAQPENGAYLDSMGWIRYQQGRYREARTYLKRALAVEEAEFKTAGGTWQQTQLAENLAVIHDHAGDVAEALESLVEARHHWERASRLDPNNEAIRAKLEDSAGPTNSVPTGRE